MPQLFSRMDEQNWLTPSIADILEQGAPPPGGDGTIREQILTLQNDLARLETPGRIINVRHTPSYTLFIVQPETVGRLGNRRTVSMQELRRSVGQIAEAHKEWRVGFMPQVEDATEVCGIMLRTDQHRPLSLRRLLVRGTFRDHPSIMAYAVGVTLDQKLIVRDLLTHPHLLVIGDGHARQHLISGVLLTLTLLNTPTELRLMITGESAAQYKILTHTPHALQDYAPEAQTTLQAVELLTREAQQRLEAFYEEGVNLLSTYNARQREQGKMMLPRIVLSVDWLADAGLQKHLEPLLTQIRDLLLNGADVGIHLIVGMPPTVGLTDVFSGLKLSQVVLRSAAPELAEKVRNFHNSLLRFIDAFVLDGQNGAITPVELCAVTPTELENAVKYWQQIVLQRGGQMPAGLTPGGTAPATTVAAEAGQVPITRFGQTQQLRPPASPIHQQATMLAAYLGWLSVGALRDILGQSDEEAATTLAALQSAGVLEKTEGGMARFVRLADRPDAR